MQYDGTVIVPSYKQKKYISDCLDSILSQQTEFKYEVIVVDSSSDGTAEFIAEKYPQVKVVSLKQRAFSGAARNEGIKIAQSDVLLFTDTDCVVDETWIQRMIAEQKQGKQAVAGVILNGTPQNLIGTADYLMECYDLLSRHAHWRKSVVGTGNVSYHRELFSQLGNFDNHVKGSDGIFARRVSTELSPIFWDPQIKIWHRNRTSLKKVIKNQIELGYGAALSRSKYGLPGKVFLKHRFLILFMPFLRSFKIAYKLLSNNVADFIRFVFLFPLIFIGLIAHAVGFYRGSKVVLKKNGT